MTGLVKVMQLGDVSFGVPNDIEQLHKPWGFYEFLGVNRTATSEEIHKAYLKMCKQLHPDAKNGDEGRFKALQQVVETLLDDSADKIGERHGKRKQYDEVSSLDSHFGEYITIEGERTRKLSEIMLKRMQIEREQAEIEVELGEASSEFTELKQKLKKTASVQEANNIQERMREIFLKSKGLDETEWENAKQIQAELEKRHEKTQEDFLRQFTSDPERYFAKALDLFYLGGNITFGTNISRLRLGLIDSEVKKNILSLVLGGDCYIAGFPQVHFKSEEAQVRITDPKLTGIIQVINGDVNVEYGSSSYCHVIQARAPEVKSIEGFAQKGDLFIPEIFATRNWWKKKPSLTIAVREGSVRLDLSIQDLILYKSLYDEIKYNSLEKIIDNNISDKYLDKLKKY